MQMTVSTGAGSGGLGLAREACAGQSAASCADGAVPSRATTDQPVHSLDRVAAASSTLRLVHTPEPVLHSRAAAGAHLMGASTTAWCRGLLCAVGCARPSVVLSRPPAMTARTTCTRGLRRRDRRPSRGGWPGDRACWPVLSTCAQPGRLQVHSLHHAGRAAWMPGSAARDFWNGSAAKQGDPAQVQEGCGWRAWLSWPWLPECPSRPVR